MDLTADFETDTTSGNLPSEIKSTILAHQDDLIGFLGLIQYFRVPLIPITWQPALGPLGRGATAYVNQAAVNVEMSHAFKRMRSHTCFDTWVNEVMILGRLGNHPNIASIEACCLEILDNGKLSPVLVFKKADFGDLEAFMRSKAGLTMNDEDVVRLCAGIGSGLQHIHLSNIVHGDIKPLNILVFGQANGEIAAKITDFGHASLRLTEDENVRLPFSRYFNAPDYHSREFRIGDAKKFDVFNFGLIVYWLLVGRKIEAEEIRFDEDTLPFARTILSKSDLSIKQRENVLAFFLFTLADNHRDRSVEWDLLLSLLGKDDQELMLEEADSSIMDENALDSRHSENTPKRICIPNLNYLALADPYIRTEIIRGLHHSYESWSCDPCRRHNAFQIALCAFMGFGGLSHSCNYAVELERSGYTLQELEQEVDFIRTMGPNAGLPDYSSSYFSEYLFNIDPNMEYRNIRVEDLSLLKELHMKEIDSCEKVLGNRHVVIITLKRALADMLKSRSRFEEAATILAETLRSVDDMMVGMKIQMDIANIYRIQKRAILAEKKTAEVFAGLQETIGAEHSYTLSAGSSLASIWSELGRLKESEDLLDQLISVKKAKFGVEHPSTIETTAVLAAVYYNQMRYVDAERLQTHILQVRERTLGVEHGFTWTSRLNLAAIYCKQNRIKEAEVIELQVLEFRRKQAGSKHYLTLTALSNLAMTYRLQKRWAEEEEALIEVISGRIEVLGPDHPDTMTSIQALANNYLSQRSPHKAEPLLRKMIEGRSRRPDIGPTHPSTLASRTSLAWTFFDQGKHGEAESMQSETIAEGEQALGVLHQAVLHCKRHSAMMFKHLGRLEEAKRVYQDVWQIQMQSRGLTDPDTNQTALHIAEIDELINQSNATRRCVDSCSLT